MRERELVTRVVFVRHGETDFPIDRIYCDDREDPTLNEEGKSQAVRAANRLKGEDIAALYVSPCARTRMTAKAILAHHAGVHEKIEPNFRERRFGVWEGLFFREIEAEYAENYKAWKKNQAGYRPRGGESVFDVQGRVVPVVEGVVDAHKGNVVVIVAHVGPIRVMLADAIGLPVDAYRRLQVDPASISIVDYGRSQNNLILLNSTGAV